MGFEVKTLLLGLLGLLTFAFDRKPYADLIKRWSSLFHIKIKYHHRYSDKFSVDVVDDILYISRFNKATHDEREYLYSIAHEFGHLIDYAYVEYYYDEEELYDKLTDKHAIYEDEIKAWKIAKILLQQAGEYDSKSFNQLKRKCLKEYQQALGLKRRVKKSSTTK